jgi:hypothetical protein
MKFNQKWVGGCVKGTDRDGEPLWYGEEFVGLMRLVIAGNPQGESVLEREAEKGALSLSIYITPEEAEKITEMMDQ